jgi:hypothetical protein
MIFTRSSRHSIETRLGTDKVVRISRLDALKLDGCGLLPFIAPRGNRFIFIFNHLQSLLPRNRGGVTAANDEQIVEPLVEDTNFSERRLQLEGLQRNLLSGHQQLAQKSKT